MARNSRGPKPKKQQWRPRGSNNTWSAGNATMSMVAQPRFKPVIKLSRTLLERFDISTDGINPSLNAILFTLDQLPDYTDFTRLFQTYRITRVDITWTPEYTELTDAALVSNAVNVYFNSAIDQASSASPASVDEVIQYQTCNSTGITKVHKRSVRVSALMNSMPCNCMITTQQPSERHYGLKIGIPPTGVAMTFRSKAKFYLELAGAY